MCDLSEPCGRYQARRDLHATRSPQRPRDATPMLLDRTYLGDGEMNVGPRLNVEQNPSAEDSQPFRLVHKDVLSEAHRKQLRCQYAIRNYCASNYGVIATDTVKVTQNSLL